MAFKNCVCWDPGEVDRVMNTEALQPSPSVFFAVHHPVKMVRTTYAGLYQGRSEQAALYTEKRFIKDLLQPEDFAFVPVIGKAGSGKSHLVRWLSLNMPATRKRHVLLIPKIDTNLWDVLNRILGLPAIRDKPAFDEYRTALRKVRSELRSEEHAREELLNKLALACGVNGPHKMQGLSQVQQDLASNLPNLLYDPFFREILLAPGGVIDRLVKHTIGQSSVVERLEERRQFKAEDLPLRASQIKKASAKAQVFYGRLAGMDLLQQEAVSWLNRHLNTAITELLDFSADALLRLFLEVRTALARDHVELVLLIEDFQKCQGIELQLLEAIIAKPHQEGRDRLCPLRTVLACNKGYFNDVPETIKTRADFYVTLDLETVRRGEVVDSAEAQQFVARYLNATRLGEERLTVWHAAARAEEDEHASQPPSACAGCEHREPCHTAFGASDGFGLYPFTPTALPRMSDRASPDGFNPRLILKDVLKPILTSYAADLREGRFPPLALVDHFKGSTLSAAVKSELSRLDPNPATRDRRLALLDLWTNGATVRDVEFGIHEAFSLPPLGSIAPPPPEPTAPAGSPPTPGTPPRPGETPSPGGISVPELPRRLLEQLQLLDAWSNGDTLSQDIVNVLRKPVFDSVQARINWDAELLVEGFFCGEGRPFKRTSVNFHNQSRQQSQALVQLTIPLEPEAPNAFTDAAIALQGLLLSIHYKGWNFRYGNHPGSFYLRRYGEQLERWAATVLSQVRRPHQGEVPWDPAPAAAELLALAARMANRPAASRTTADTQLNALFQSLQGISVDHRSPAWKELFVTLCERQSVLCEILLSHAACTKGGSRRVQVVDAQRVIKTLHAIRKDYHPREGLPEKPWETYAWITKLREKVNVLLGQAIDEEKARLIAWADQVALQIGPEEAWPRLIEGVRQVIAAAHEELGFTGASYENLVTAVDKFNSRQLSQCFESIAKLKKETDSGPLLVELGRDMSEIVAMVNQFLSLTTQFLEKHEPRVESDIAQLSGVGEFKTTQTEIGTALDTLHSLLTDIRGETT